MLITLAGYLFVVVFLALFALPLPAVALALVSVVQSYQEESK